MSSERTFRLLLWITGIPVVALFALALSQPSEGARLASLSEALENPLALRPTAETPRLLTVLLLLYGASAIGIEGTRPHLRSGAEHGSARWGNPRSVCKEFAQAGINNLLLTQSVYLGLDSRRHRRNLNVLVVGGSGSGKTRFYAKPNLLQCNTSYVITDPKGELLRDTGSLLQAKGYRIRVLNLVDFSSSDGYNPFAYIRDEKDVLKLVTNLIRNTTPRSASSSDPFWEKSETALLEALLFYLRSEAPEEEQNFSMVLTMLEYADVHEEDEDRRSPLDLLFEALEREQPDHIAVRQYKVFKLAAGDICSK